MKLVLEGAAEWRAGETVTMRLVVFNDAYEPVAFDRRLLVGPNFEGLPPAMEPGFAEDHANHVILNPFCLYGRERSYEEAPAGERVVEGYLLAAAGGEVAVRAEPLRLTVR